MFGHSKLVTNRSFMTVNFLTINEYNTYHAYLVHRDHLFQPLAVHLEPLDDAPVVRHVKHHVGS